MIRFFSRLAHLTAALAASGLVWTAPPRETIVSVDVLVMDQNGQPVQGLGQEQFQVVADGQERRILSFTTGRMPLDIVLLLDLTSSISRTLERDALESDIEDAIIDGLQDGERLRIASFAREMILNNGLSRDRRRLRNELRTAFSHRRQNLYGPSPVWDATHRAVESFPESGARRAIVLVTDGRATGNRLTVDEVAKAAVLTRTSIHIVGQDVPVQVRQSESLSVLVRPGAALEWLATVTGGRFIAAAQEGVRPAAAFAGIFDALRHTYTLSFEAGAIDGNLHTLQVHVRRGDLKVRARGVYNTAG